MVRECGGAALVQIRQRLWRGMVSRTTKLIAAGLVLAAGVGLAWPFRRTEGLEPPKPPAVAAPVPATPPINVAARPISPPASVAASFAADTNLPTQENSRSSARAVQLDEPPPVVAPVAVAPVESTIDAAPAEAPPESVAELNGPPAERIHIVHDGDSLERLAKRYLGDESRALEIFDLNRGTLENPHWLPIGAELRLPPRSPDEEI